MHNKYLKTIFLITIQILCVLNIQIEASEKANTFTEVICRSIKIKTVEDFNRLENCTLLVGHVHIVEVQFFESNLTELRSSSLEEITDYLFIYHVEGLESLYRLFPKLILIRGSKLFYDQYALVVLENHNLKNIGLVSLLRVLKGSIRVERNPALCYSQTINWVKILGSASKDYFYSINDNKPPTQCPLCYAYTNDSEQMEEYRHKECWSIGKYQKSINCKEFCNVDSACLSSCSNKKCRRCSNYISNGACVDKCMPPVYKLAYERQCVANCAELDLIQLGMVCVEKCPRGYREVTKNNVVSCALNCSGNFIVNNAEQLQGLAECNIIDGSLTIEIHDQRYPIVRDLENAFRHLNEITGYLKIVNSPQIISLHFFENLHTIGGTKLIGNTYSVYIVDNNFLQELWVGSVAVLRGCVYFHLNPRLCYNKIISLQNNLKQCPKISIRDASPHSNGERVVCGNDLRSLGATVTDVNSNSAIVEAAIIPYDEHSFLYGYVYFYKEAPFRNVTKYDGRHGCGRDEWFTDTRVTKERRHILTNLKPATQYAYFINTLVTMDYPDYFEHISDIHYFKTLPSKPEMVAKLYYHSLSREEIELHWWPPRVANGIIEKYILQFEETNSTMHPEIMDQRTNEVCDCPRLHTESHVPTPHIEDIYSKEKLLYIDSLMNFLLVKRVTPPSKRVRRDLLNKAIFQANNTGEDRYMKFLEKMAADHIKVQDAGKENYVIPHAPAICDQPKPSIQMQTASNCVPLETYQDAITIPGDRHIYVLQDLEPEKTYRISLRACVKGLKNACGPAKVIYAETVSKSLEKIIESMGFSKYAAMF